MYIHFYFILFLSLPKDMLIDFREKERKRERERNTDRLPLVHTPTGDKTCNTSLSPDRESNL